MIDIDRGQLDYYDQRPAVTFPCCLIDFPNMTFADEGQNVQWANVAVKVRLGFSPFSSAASIVPDVAKEQAMQFWEMENKVFKALQGWMPVLEINGEEVDIAQPMTRVAANKEMREDPFIVVAMDFTTAGEDESVATPIAKHQADLVIDPELGS